MCATSSFTVLGYTFVRYFVYTGVTEDKTVSNPSTETFLPDVFTLDGSKDARDAIPTCIKRGLQTSNKDFSMDLHWDISTGSWTCVGFWDQNTDVTQFNVVNSDVGQVYGFNFKP